MKKILKHLFFFSLLAVLFASCKKDENQVIYETGTEPVLEARDFSSPVTLLIANQNDHALTLAWTNPDYKFNTGISSQNVSYTIQIDTVGANFTNPKKVEIAVLNDLSFDFTVNDLNDALVSATKLSLKADIPHNIEIRIKSTMSNGTVPLYSNVITYTDVIPYPDPNVPRLWITGSGVPSNWTNTPPADQEFSYMGDLKFELLINFNPGGAYKFLTKQGQWQPQWGGCSPAGGPLSVNPGGGTDPAEIATPAVPGLYKISVNLEASDPRCTIVLQ
jgi:hypothetical protein